MAEWQLIQVKNSETGQQRFVEQPLYETPDGKFIPYVYMALPASKVTVRNPLMTGVATTTDTVLTGYYIASTVTPITFVHFYNGIFTAAQLAGKTPDWTVRVPATGTVMESTLDLGGFTNGITVAPSTVVTGYTAPATGLFIEVLTRAA